MRDCDRAAIENHGIPGICLMEAAGIALADACAEELGGTVRGKVLTVVCGKGNNGGDGFVAARHLHTRGADVRVLAVGFAPDDLTGDAATQYAILSTLNVDMTIFPIPPGTAITFKYPIPISTTSLIIDCIHGTGFRPPLSEWARFLIETVRDVGAKVISCDIPSGVNADTGEVGEGGAFQATRTVCLAGLKRGLLFHPGAAFAGRVTVAPIGFPPTILNEHASAELTTGDWVRSKLPPRRQSRDANKGRFGTVLVIAGSNGMAGAATLAASAALRAGAGLVHLAVPESLLNVTSVLAPELVLHGLSENDGSHGGDGADKIALELAEKADAVVIGCGFGAAPSAKTLAQTIVQTIAARKMLVVDADALNALADLGDAAHFPDRNADNTIFTPHPGEAGRLLGCEARIIQENRPDAVRQIAQKYGVTVLLKGSRTLIGTNNPAARLGINRAGSVALATAGSGDVLAGVIAALLADRENNLTATDAARIGAYLHAVAGEICEKQRGAVGTIAPQIRDALPKARRIIENTATGSFYDV